MYSVMGNTYPKQEALNDLYYDICVYTRGAYRSIEFIRHVFCYLRAHRELCAQSGYQRLYRECLSYLLLDLEVRALITDSDRKDAKKWLEILADYDNATATSPHGKLSLADVEAYLWHRTLFWNM